MKNIEKKFNKIFNEYLKNLPKQKVFFDKSFVGEKLYLQHHKKRYLQNIKFFEEYYLQNQKSELKVLDIGASPFSFLLKKMFPDIDLNVVDLSVLMKKRCEDFTIHFNNYDISKYPFKFTKNKFNFIFFTEVLEHLFSDQNIVLKELQKLLLPGGILFIQTPNGISLDRRFKFLFGKNIFVSTELFSNQKYGIDHHLIEYSRSDLLEIINKGKQSKILSVSFPLYYDNVYSGLTYKKNKLLFFFPVAFYCLITRVIPSFRRGIQIVLKKNEI